MPILRLAELRNSGPDQHRSGTLSSYGNTSVTCSSAIALAYGRSTSQWATVNAEMRNSPDFLARGLVRLTLSLFSVPAV